MGRILIDLIDDIELIIINIFQTGIKSVSEEMLLEMEVLVKQSEMLSLSYISTELQNLHKLLLKSKYESEFNYDEIAKKIAILSQSIMIIKKKINYDLTGGY